MVADGVKAQCVVTSPPYFRLRDYGVRGQLGLESSWVGYVARVRGVMRRVREVLADDGIAWLNLGDSYYSPREGGSVGVHSTINGQHTQLEFRKASRNRECRIHSPDIDGPNRRRHLGLKAKDLIGMPWRVAFALQMDGWWLRSDVVWSKANPMPESVSDRPTKSHEYVFLLAKSERYFYDAAAIAEPATYAAPNGAQHSPYGQGITPRSVSGNSTRKLRDDHLGNGVPWEGLTRNVRSVWTIVQEPFPGAHFATFPRNLVRRCILAGSRPGDVVFDPFMGSGTVAEVADSLGRRFIGCELNPQYAAMYGRDRAAQIGMGLG
jgi:site-specific DNA-methyltransferase (cytosine-N4-specific)